MKIVLTQVEFETMAAAWVYENLVEKKMLSAKIVGDEVELEVFEPSDMPVEESEEKVEEVVEDVEEDIEDNIEDYNRIRTGTI
jgi:hypothetical protein